MELTEHWIYLIPIFFTIQSGLCASPDSQKYSLDIQSDLITNEHIPITMEPAWITISPLHRAIKLGTAIIEKEVQLNWNPSLQYMNGTFDSVALYKVDPYFNAFVKPDVLIKVSDYPNGFYQTNISTTDLKFPGGWDKKNIKFAPEIGEHCLPYWIALYTNEALIYQDCLKIRPTWMYDNRMFLGSMSPISLFLPGTSNSACFLKIDRTNINNPILENALTQDVDVWEQLVFGIRYVNIQTGYYQNKKKNYKYAQADEANFFVNNDVIKIRPLAPVLQDIRRFLEFSQHEIILLDFSQFAANINSDIRHDALTKMILREFHDIAFPSPDHFLNLPSLDTMWKENKRIIIFYNHEEITRDEPLLWSPLQNFDSHEQTVAGLHRFIDSTMSKSDQIVLTGGLWNIMAHIIPDPLIFYTDPSEISLRELSEDSNKNITSWFENYLWKRSNIVSMDFFLNSNLINIAISTNVYKGYSLKDGERNLTIAESDNHIPE